MSELSGKQILVSVCYEVVMDEPRLPKFDFI